MFEINRNFRNEGVGYRWNPEFTMLEFYWAYADYNDLMALTEEMLPYVVQFALGALETTWNDKPISFAAPFVGTPFRTLVAWAAGKQLGHNVDDRRSGRSTACPALPVGWASK